MICTCNYDNTPAPGGEHPERCEGCGVPLQPADDQEPPAPGHEVPRTKRKLVEYDHDGAPVVETEREEIFIVDDEDREQWPELEDILVIHELSYDWGRGIGAEPYGYYTKSKEVTREAEEPCERCGSDEERSSFASDGVVAGGSVECERCGLVKEEWHD